MEKYTVVGRFAWKGSRSKEGAIIYKAFGINIYAEIELPELAVTDETPEVRIVLGKTPLEIAGAMQINKNSQVARNEFLFLVPKVANYYVTNGNAIVIDIAPQAEERAVRLYLLGTAFGVLLLQRGVLPIHGSAVDINGRCAIFTGASGAGKSTLVAAFHEREYSLLTDDVAAISFDEAGQPFVQPGYPQQKLWRDSAEGIGLNVRTFTKVKADMDKYAVPVHKAFCSTPLPLAAVYEINPGLWQEVGLSRLYGVNKLAVLLNNTYRVKRLTGLGLREAHFQQCAKVARHIEVFRLCRPEGVFSVDELMRLVLQAMGA